MEFMEVLSVKLFSSVSPFTLTCHPLLKVFFKVKYKIYPKRNEISWIKHLCDTISESVSLKKWLGNPLVSTFKH